MVLVSFQMSGNEAENTQNPVQCQCHAFVDFRTNLSKCAIKVSTMIVTSLSGNYRLDCLPEGIPSIVCVMPP